MLTYLLERLKEPSTSRGIVALFTAGGLVLSPEQGTAIVSLGLALIGIIGALTKDAGAAK